MWRRGEVVIYDCSCWNGMQNYYWALQALKAVPCTYISIQTAGASSYADIVTVKDWHMIHEEDISRLKNKSDRWPDQMTGVLKYKSYFDFTFTSLLWLWHLLLPQQVSEDWPFPLPPHPSWQYSKCYFHDLCCFLLLPPSCEVYRLDSFIAKLN